MYIPTDRHGAPDRLHIRFLHQHLPRLQQSIRQRSSHSCFHSVAKEHARWKKGGLSIRQTSQIHRPLHPSCWRTSQPVGRLPTAPRHTAINRTGSSPILGTAQGITTRIHFMSPRVYLPCRFAERQRPPSHRIPFQARSLTATHLLAQLFDLRLAQWLALHQLGHPSVHIVVEGHGWFGGL